MFTPPQSLDDIPSVEAMIKSMDRTVAGLEDFKHRLAVTLRDHMVAAVMDRDWHGGNILIVGPTGVGKTYTVKALLRAIPVCWCEVAVTEFSDVGYHGRDLVTMYLGLLSRAQREENAQGRPISLRDHLPRAERWGVVLMDEMDKLRTNKTAVPGEREVGKVLQYELLKLVEGTEANIREDEDKPGILFQTSHVLHVGMGAFVGLNDTIALWDKKPWDERLYLTATPEDFIEYGFIPELMGRFATILTLPPLKVDHLIRILREQLVPRWVERMADEGLALGVDEGAMMTIAGMAQERALGARALEPILADMLWRPRREARPGDELILDARAVASKSARLQRAEAA
jgi:ATP-dependent Clp protease ATP-binding subunit ClpX